MLCLTSVLELCVETGCKHPGEQFEEAWNIKVNIYARHQGGQRITKVLGLITGCIHLDSC